METLYYEISNSQIRIISQDIAEEYEKQWVFFTTWKEIEKIEDSHIEINNEWDQRPVYAYNEVFIKIFDLDKNSSLPELRFLDTYKPSGGLPFNPFWPWFIFIMVLWSIFLYFTFFWEEQKIVPENNTSTGITNIVSSALPWNWNITPIATQTPESVVPVTPVTPSDSVEKNFMTQIEWLELSGRRKDYELQDLQIQYNRVNRELVICKNDVLEAKNIAKDYLKESLEKTDVISQKETEIQQVKQSLLQNNQLYLYLWEYLFDVCETQEENAKCKEIIYNFYNLRK